MNEPQIGELIPPVHAPALSPRSEIGDRRSEIGQLVDLLKDKPQLEMPVTHHFAPGIYTREIFMPADAFVIGHIHKTEHLNIVLTGRAAVIIDGRPAQEIAAPCVFKSGAGVQKILHIKEDMRWLTVHVNAGDCRDIAVLEESLLELPPEFLAAKGAQTIDQFRMSNQTAEPKEILP